MKRLLLVIAPLILLAGCYKEAQDKLSKLHGVKWSGAYAISAVDVDLNLDDAVKMVSKFTNTGSYLDEVLYVAYEETEISKTGNEIFPLTDQSANSSSTLTGGEQALLVANGSTAVNRNLIFPFTMSGIPELDSIQFSEGNFTLSFLNNYDHPCAGTITIMDMRKQGALIQYSVNLAARATYNAAENLKDMIADLTKGGTGYNELRINLALNYTYSGSPIGGADNMSMNYSFNTLAFSRLYGYFGTFNALKALDSVELSLFTRGLKYGSFHFEDPRLKLKYYHNTGIPFQLQTHGLYGYKSGGTTPITGYPANTPIPALTLSQQGMTYSDSLVVTHPSSNIQSIIDAEPSHIMYDFDVVGNSPPSSGRNWILGESKVTVTVVQELPFHGLAGSAELSDTVDFSLNIENIEKTVEWLNLRIHVDNEIPVALGFQGYFMDSFGNVLDSLFKPFRDLAPAASIDGSGLVVASSSDVFDVEFTKDRIAKIVNAQHLWFRAFMNTAKYNGNQIPVKVTRSQHLRIKLGVHVKLSHSEKI